MDILLGGGTVWTVVCLYYEVRCVEHNCMLILLCPLLPRCIAPDPSETAKDMIESYKKECSLLKIRPISKLLEQLEVGHMTCHMTIQLHVVMLYFSALTI